MLGAFPFHVQLYVKAVTPVLPISSPGAPWELLNVPDWPGSWRGLTDKGLRMRTHAEINSWYAKKTKKSYRSQPPQRIGVDTPYRRWALDAAKTKQSTPPSTVSMRSSKFPISSWTSDMTILPDFRPWVLAKAACITCHLLWALTSNVLLLLSIKNRGRPFSAARYIGVTVDESLTWKAHVAQSAAATVKSASQCSVTSKEQLTVKDDLGFLLISYHA